MRSTRSGSGDHGRSRRNRADWPLLSSSLGLRGAHAGFAVPAHAVRNGNPTTVGPRIADLLPQWAMLEPGWFPTTAVSHASK